MRRLLVFPVVLAICIAVAPDASWAQSNPEIEHKPAEVPAKANTEQQFTSDQYLLGEYMLEAGDRLKRAYRRSQRTTDSLGEELMWGLIRLTFGTFVGGFIGPYHIGNAGEQLIGASTVISPQRAPLMKLAGQELKACRKLGYWNSGLFWGGLIMALSGTENEAVVTAGGLSMLAGWGFGIIAPRHVGFAGKALEDISGAFPTATQRMLMKEAGKSLQSYTKCTYWGRGLQALGITAAIIGFDQGNTTVGVTGILTTVVGMVLSDKIAPTSIESAGERLEELGNIL